MGVAAACDDRPVHAGCPHPLGLVLVPHQGRHAYGPAERTERHSHADSDDAAANDQDPLALARPSSQNGMHGRGDRIDDRRLLVGENVGDRIQLRGVRDELA